MGIVPEKALSVLQIAHVWETIGEVSVERALVWRQSEKNVSEEGGVDARVKECVIVETLRQFVLQVRRGRSSTCDDWEMSTFR